MPELDFRQKVDQGLRQLDAGEGVDHDEAKRRLGLSIEKLAKNGEEFDEDEYLPFIAEDGDPNLTWEDVRAVLAKLPGSLTEDFDRERDERF